MRGEVEEQGKMKENAEKLGILGGRGGNAEDHGKIGDKEEK